MVERKPSKLHTWVRFPSPAPISNWSIEINGFVRFIWYCGCEAAPPFCVNISDFVLHIFFCSENAKMVKKLISINVYNGFAVLFSAKVFLQIMVILFNIHEGFVSMCLAMKMTNVDNAFVSAFSARLRFDLGLSM